MLKLLAVQVVSIHNASYLSMPGGSQFFLFCLVVSYSVCFLLEFEATSHNAMFVGRVVVFFRRGETQFTYRLNE